MRRPTKKYLQTLKPERESEFEKPYQADDYSQMQHFAPKTGSLPPWTMPGWNWPQMPEMPGPSLSAPQRPYRLPSGRWSVPGGTGDRDNRIPMQEPSETSRWLPTMYPCFGFDRCSDYHLEVDASGCGTLCIKGFCATNIGVELHSFTTDASNWHITGTRMVEPPLPPQPRYVGGVLVGQEWLNMFSGKFCVDICYTGSDMNATGRISFYDLGYDPPDYMVSCEIRANCCELATTMTYSAGNPTTIAQSSEEAITVDNGCGSFNWSVSGTGFTFAQNQTTIGANTLEADGSACGPATITVTDGCGTEVTGYVRGTTGTWSLTCTGDNDSGSCASWATYDEYPDNITKLELAVGCHYTPYNCIYFSCGGYTSYIPAAANNKCGTTEWEIDCDIEEAICYHASVWLSVYNWSCA